MYLFYQPELPDATYLDKDESRHCIKVLRKQAGDEIVIIDGKGQFFTASITIADAKKCEFSIKETRKESSPLFKRHIAIAPTKNIDRIEWFVEKAVEFGIDEISFIICEHSERTVVKLDRIERKAISAMKQSYKATLPKINGAIAYNQFINNCKEKNRCIAYVDFENDMRFQDKIDGKTGTLILIGPEGDFSDNELTLATESNFTKVSLGNSRLRTETAGIAAAMLLNLSF